MEISNYKEVYFHEYCKKCESVKLEETDEPCFECLENPYNENSHKPIRFKERNL